MQVVAHRAEPGEVGVHLRLGLLGGDPQLLGQPVHGQPVGQAVGHRLDPAAQLRRHLLRGHAERPGRDKGVQVLAGAERLDQPLVAGQVRHDPHLDLAVVGGHQHAVGGTDHERLPDPPALVGADGDVLQVGVGGGQPAGGGDGLLEGGVDAPVVGDRPQQTVHCGLQLVDVPVGQQVLEERVLGGRVEVLQRLRVGGVAGLGALGLGHAQLVEQHDLELLGRAEVDLLADHPVGVLRDLLEPGEEVGGQRGQVVDVDRDAGRLHLGQHRHQRHLHLGEQPLAADPLQRQVQRLGQFGDRLGPHQLRTGGPLLVVLLGAEQGQLTVVLGLLGPQLPLQVAQHQVVQGERALAGAHQVGGQRGVHAQSGHGPAAGAQRAQPQLQVVAGLGHVRVGQPGGQRLLVGLGERGHVQVAALAVDRGQGQPDQVGATGSGGAGRGREAQGQADPAGPGVLVQPLGHGVRGDPSAADLEALLGLRLGGGQGGEQPVPQHAELQVVEQAVHGIPVPRPQHQVVGLHADLDVVHQLGELAVEQHAVQVRAQRVTGLAPHLVHPVDQAVQRAVLGDPLGDGLLPHPRDLGQVVRGVAAQRGEVGVLGRRQPVLLHHRLGREPGQVGHALARVQHGDLVVDQLQHVPVAGADDHGEALGRGHRGQGGDDVVGLVVLLAQHRDVERAQHLLDQADLTLELVGRGRPVRLVLGVGLGAEGLAGDVEGHRDVRGLLVAQQVDEHGGEPVHGVGELPGVGLEVLLGQRVERPVGHGVAVDQQQLARARAGGGRGHASTSLPVSRTARMVVCPRLVRSLRWLTPRV